MAYQISNVLEITPEEEEAIDWYQSNSTKINELMGNFISDAAKKQYNYERNGGHEVEPYYTPQKVEKLMDCIEKIYSAMVKTSMNPENSRPYRLYRGTASMINDSSENAFFSTTTSKDEALLFAASKKFYDERVTPHLSYIDVSGNVPYYIMPDKGNENEVLLSPFLETKVTNSYGGQWSGYNILIHSVSLKRCELRDFPDLDRDNARKRLLESAETIGTTVNNYMRLSREQDTNIQYDPEVGEQMYQKSKEITTWKKDFRIFMEARCRDIEKNIELELQLEAKREEERKAEQARIAAEQRKRDEEKKRDNSAQIRGKIRNTKDVMERQLRSSMQMFKNAKRFGIDYVSPSNNVLNAVNSWGFSSDKADENTLHRINSMMENVNARSGSMGKELNQIEEKEIKKTMAEKVMEIRMQQEMDILQEEANSVKAQKIGFFGKLLGKEKKRKEKEQELDGKIQRMRDVIGDLRDYGLSSEKDYSTHDILAEMEIAKNIGGISLEASQELNGYSAYINQTYRIDQQRVAKMVNQKATNLANSERSGIVIGAYREKMGDANAFQNRTTDIEKFCSTIGRSVRSLDREPDYLRDFDRAYR